MAVVLYSSAFSLVTCSKVIYEGIHNLPENHWPQDSPNLPAFVQGQGEVFMLHA